MPVCPFSVVTSTNRNATSVIGFCRPVSTLASLIGVASGRVIEEIFRCAIRSSVASPAEAAISVASGAVSALLGAATSVVAVMAVDSSRTRGRVDQEWRTPSTRRGTSSSSRSSGGSSSSGTSW